MGVHELPGGAGRVEVIAGEYRGAKGPASTFTPIQMYKARLKAGAEAVFAFPETYNAGLLVLEGGVSVDGSEAPADNFVLFRNDGESFTVRAETDSVILVLAGEPIDEPIAAYGPFVMNTQEEIHQAVEDFQAGNSGAWSNARATEVRQ